MPSISVTLAVASLSIHAAVVTSFLPTPFGVFPFQAKLNSAVSLSAQDNGDDDGKTKLTVALTRESGKNQKLKEAVADHPTTRLLAGSLAFDLIEMPCVKHAEGPDVQAFADMIGDNEPCTFLAEKYDYTVITSPEGAKVFAGLLQGKDGGDSPSLSDLPAIAAVGKATQQTLVDLGFTVSFTPSQANGETLAAELPPVDKVKLTRVLYPASNQADDTIRESLEDGRKDCSFEVTRFNTYDTVPVEFDEGDRDVMMNKVDLAMFGSPSAVKAWLGNVDVASGTKEEDLEEKLKEGVNCNGNVIAVCIGKTTASACLQSKRWVSNDIYYPSKNPGMKGWVDSCVNASGDVMEKAFWGTGDQ